MSADDSRPTSQPRRVPGAFRHRRLSVMLRASAASSAPAPSRASTPAATSCHHVPPRTLRLADANSTARQPSGQCSSVGDVPCRSAAAPTTVGDAWLVPVIVIPSAVTATPFAEISGSSRSPWGDDGLRNTDDVAIEPASSSWLPTEIVLYPLWFTYSLLGG